MADMTEPSVDFLEQFIAKADVMAADMLRRLEESVQGGGRKTIRVQCPTCGNQHNESVEVIDAKELRDTFALITSAKKAYADISAKRAGDDTSRRAGSELRAIEDMSGEEIAAEIAHLRGELNRAS